MVGKSRRSSLSHHRRQPSVIPFRKGGALAAGKDPNRIYSARESVVGLEAGDSFHNFPESFSQSISMGNRQVISDDCVLYP